jgi:uncharacterized Fe-S cluster protein YjdI
MSNKKELIKEYKADELTVLWKPDQCIHSKNCWKGLIQVFNPQNRPWINLEAASSERIIKQIDQCPSGALSYHIHNHNHNQNKKMENQIKVNAMENGPLLIDGIIEVTKPDGTVETKEKTTAFCRCGSSANKPYCDGQHRKIDFKG